MDDDPKPWRVKSSRYLFDEPPWLRVREDHVVLPNGVEIERYWVNEFPPWCNVVAVARDGRIVLVRQYRHGLRAVHFEIPGGVADHGTPLESAQRELLEETGYGGGTWSPLLRITSNGALQDNWTHTFLAEGVERIAEPAHDHTEDLRVHLVAPDTVPALIRDGEITGALHVAALLHYIGMR